MLKPTGLIRGHYECRSFKETVPILTKLLAFDVEAEAKGEKVLKHPNTGWRLVMHEGGPDAPIKPMRNHYGVRVTTNEEVDRATEYLEKSKDELKIKIIKPRTNHNAYSVHFYEPGGNYWEIESYEHAVEAGMVENDQPALDDAVVFGKIRGPRLCAPGFYTWHIGKRRSESFRTLLPGGTRFRGRQALAVVVLCEAPRNALVCRLPPGAETEPPASNQISTLHAFRRVIGRRTRGAPLFSPAARPMEDHQSRGYQRSRRRDFLCVQRP